MLPTCPWELQITPKSDPGDPKSQKKSFESASAFETWPGGLREALTIEIANICMGVNIGGVDLLPCAQERTFLKHEARSLGTAGEALVPAVGVVVWSTGCERPPMAWEVILIHTINYHSH